MCIVSCGGEVVSAFRGSEEVKEAADRRPERAVDGSLGGLAQERLELGEGVFDWIEVGRVGGQVEKARARRFDPLARRRPLVAGQVVHDDDIAHAQFGSKDALDIGLEGEPIDRAVEHERRNHAARRQAGDESRRFPVAVGNANPQPLAAAAAAVGPSHVGRSPGLIDEDQAFGIEIELAFEPGFAPLQDVGAVLLRGVSGLFLRVMAWRVKNRRIVP